MRGAARQIREHLKDLRQERRLVRDFHAASPREQQELFELLRRNDCD
jgi:hypothetical protein